MVGQPVLSAVAGPKGDYVLSLELGEKRTRSLRLANPRLSFLARTFEGTFSILVECAWRLDGPEGIVTSYLSQLSRDAPDLLFLGEIEGESIEAISLGASGRDLEIELTGGYRLICLSSELEGRSGRNDWSFWSAEGSVVVGPRGRLQVRQRGHSLAPPSPLERLKNLEDLEDDEESPDGEPGA